MYSTSTELAQMICSDCRMFRLILQNQTTGKKYIGDNIFTADFNMQCTSKSDDIEFGAVCAQTVNMKITACEDVFLGEKFQIFIYLADPEHPYTTYGDLAEYTYGELAMMTVQNISLLKEIYMNEIIPMGEFFCVKCKKSADVFEITLADGLYFSDKKFIPPTLPKKASEIEAEVCRQLGIPCKPNAEYEGILADINGEILTDSEGDILQTVADDFVINSVPQDTTCRQMLSYISSAFGQFGFVDRWGIYRRKWFGEPVKALSFDEIDTPTISAKENVITDVICKVGGSEELKISTGGNDRKIEFENPYVTQKTLELLFVNVRNFSWYTANIYYRLADPRLDIGDVVMLESGEKIPVTSLDFKYDGGLCADISAVGKSAEEEIEIGKE